jgi:WD40 repeat protein
VTFKKTSKGTLAFSPDVKTLALGGEWVGEIQIWDVATGKVQLTFKGYKLSNGALAFSPDGQDACSGV